MAATPQPHRPVPTSALAIWSLVLGLIGLCAALPAVGAILCGHLGISRINKSGGQLGGAGLAIAGLVLGYLGLLSWIIMIVLFIIGAQAAEEKEEAEKIASLIESVPVPMFPELPEFNTLEASGVRMARIEMPSDPSGTAGSEMTFRIYLPPGEAEPKSLACVLVAPAGTNLMSGSELDDGDYHDETLPYAEAGMAVVNYSIDGPTEDESDEAFFESYEEFKAAGAGVINGRNALELALARLPMVDPERIYSAGHSSAATLSLLLAAHESRLAGCLAYAPAVDLESHFSEMLEEPGLELAMSGFRRFVVDSSPLTHANRIEAPVFLFFAEDDTMATIESAEPFITAIQSTNTRVRLRKVPSGGHYRSMIDEGIPSGILWLRGQ